MEFLSEDVSAAREPTTEELKAWFAKNTGAVHAARARHVPALSTSRPTAAARTRGPTRRRALAKLAGKPADWPAAHALGDPFMFQDYSPTARPSRSPRTSVRRSPGRSSRRSRAPGRGPIESGYGWHLVFVDSLTPARVSAFEEVEPDVKTAWLAARKAEAWDKAYKTMRAKYELLLPAPPATRERKAMSPLAISVVIFVCVFGGALAGLALRSRLPEPHRSTETRDVVKLGMGLVATMSALLLGLLISSAKSSYDTQKTELTQVTARLVFLDHVLAHYGPETKEIRGLVRNASFHLVSQLWPKHAPGARGRRSRASSSTGSRRSRRRTRPIGCSRPRR